MGLGEVLLVREDAKHTLVLRVADCSIRRAEHGVIGHRVNRESLNRQAAVFVREGPVNESSWCAAREPLRKVRHLSSRVRTLQDLHAYNSARETGSLK